ncbi:hypothetical protein [Paenibacillus pini]|uniref:DUF5668 domain-containing protein n=1 Tax=Paenibacillus pini JCM 16418 TaxID=1236976 RepID=W7YKV9_9BACL|nr:hypothetical protein [Paenibacillus pini]GAF09117.1 hypothetical protein JCM16418_3236 [Paenibacillus pini JCM 16418]
METHNPESVLKQEANYRPSMSPDPSISSSTPPRQWRVGTLSMGCSLLLIGVVTLTSQWRGGDVFDIALKWWPAIFILLGLEMTSYSLFFNRSGKMKFDILSVFFVGILTVMCIGFAALSSLGIVQEIRKIAGGTEQTIRLPDWTENVQPTTKRMIIQGDHPYAVKIDKTSGKEMHLMASYRTRNDATTVVRNADELIQVKQVGDTMYIMFADPSQASFFESTSNALDLTVIVPQQLKVIVRDNQGAVYENNNSQ